MTYFPQARIFPTKKTQIYSEIHLNPKASSTLFGFFDPLLLPKKKLRLRLKEVKLALWFKSFISLKL